MLVLLLGAALLIGFSAEFLGVSVCMLLSPTSLEEEESWWVGGLQLGQRPTSIAAVYVCVVAAHCACYAVVEICRVGVLCRSTLQQTTVQLEWVQCSS